MQREMQFMQEAISLGRKGMMNNEGGPFGCVIVKGDNIIGRGWNRVLATNDPTAHAEIVAIRDACKNLQTFQLDDCEIYATCEPCPMCMAAIYWSRPRTVYYASSRKDAANIGFDDEMIYRELEKSLEQRAMVMHCLGGEDAIKLFEEWHEKGNKNLY